MPIKELITAGLISAGVIAAAHPFNLRGALLREQLRILNAVGNTSNWGDPRYWKQPGYKRVHARKLDKHPN